MLCRRGMWWSIGIAMANSFSKWQTIAWYEFVLCSLNRCVCVCFVKYYFGLVLHFCMCINYPSLSLLNMRPSTADRFGKVKRWRIHHACDHRSTSSSVYSRPLWPRFTRGYELMSRHIPTQSAQHAAVGCRWPVGFRKLERRRHHHPCGSCIVDGSCCWSIKLGIWCNLLATW